MTGVTLARFGWHSKRIVTTNGFIHGPDLLGDVWLAEQQLDPFNFHKQQHRTATFNRYRYSPTWGYSFDRDFGELVEASYRVRLRDAQLIGMFTAVA